MPLSGKLGYNAILVVIDRFTKIRYLIPMKYYNNNSSAKAVAQAYLTYM